MLQGAILGLGNVALNGHLPAWEKESHSSIVAGIDSDRNRWKSFNEQLPSALSVPSLAECRSLNLNFVDICTPPFTHAPLVLEALKKGYHVLCEKPLALLPQEMEDIESALRSGSCTIVTVHNWKFAPICRKVSEILKEKRIGKIRHIAWYVLRSGPAITTELENWRLDPKKAGGGILIDHGWHAFYLLLGWIEGNLTQVSATLEKREYENLGVEDTSKIQLEFETSEKDRVTSEVFLTWASRIRRNWGVVEGTEGTVQLEDGTLILEQRGERKEVFQYEPLSMGSHHPEWFSGVIQEFLEEIQYPERRGSNFKVAQICHQIIEKCKESQKR